MAPFLWVLLLGGLLSAWTRLRSALDPRERALAGLVLGSAAVAGTFLLYPSDPRDWSLARAFLYLSAPSLEPAHVLGNLLLGGLAFALAALAVYWANRR